MTERKDSEAGSGPGRRQTVAARGVSLRRSLNARILFGAGVSLLVFMVLLGFILDRAFSESALRSVVDRLQTEIYMLLGATDIRADGQFTISTPLPEPRLEMTESDLFARVFDENGVALWRSPSSFRQPAIAPKFARAGDFVFDRIAVETGAPDIFCMHFTVLWEAEDGNTRKVLTLQVCETPRRYRAQVAGFRRSLSFWFVVAGAGFLIMNTLFLQQALTPLRKVADEVTRIESGEKDALTGQYPLELQPLATNLNLLIRQGQNHVKRYRNALGDLAHSLKTPLAVLRTSLEQPEIDDEDRRSALDQLNRVDATIQYQLQRAAAAQKTGFGAVETEPVVSRLASSLRKVYASRQLTIATEVEPGARFFGEQQDLYEILGNLADNACKWAETEVRIRVCSVPPLAGRLRPALDIEVTDDGPGMTREAFDRYRGRGVRGDSTVDGHGIGLAIVSELVEKAYEGTVELRPFEPGTRIGVRLEFG